MSPSEAKIWVASAHFSILGDPYRHQGLASFDPPSCGRSTCPGQRAQESEGRGEGRWAFGHALSGREGGRVGE